MSFRAIFVLAALTIIGTERGFAEDYGFRDQDYYLFNLYKPKPKETIITNDDENPVPVTLDNDPDDPIFVYPSRSITELQNFDSRSLFCVTINSGLTHRSVPSQLLDSAGCCAAFMPPRPERKAV